MRPLARAPMAVLVTLVAVTTTAGPTLSDTQIIDTGRVGPHRLRDSDRSPGAACVYDTTDDMTLTNVRVRPPVLRARDRTDARDRQWLGWRAAVRGFAWDPWEDGHWEVVARSPIARAQAWDDTSARFEPVDLAIPGGYDRYTVRVEMRWYRPGGTSDVVGSASHLVDWYAVEGSEPWPDCVGWVG